MPDTSYDQQLEAAAERIRALELHLFERDRGPQDRDVDLGSLLEAPPPMSDQAVRRATRYRFSAAIDVHIDGDAGVLVDLSVGGAQMLCSKELEVNHVARISLLSDEIPISCQGRIMWSWLEPYSKGQPPSHRVGICFTAADEAALEAFIIRYSASS